MINLLLDTINKLPLYIPLNDVSKFVEHGPIEPVQGTAAVLIASAIGAVISLGTGIAGKASSNAKAREEQARARKAERRLKALEASRQPVIDQSDKIRGLKDQVFNPYANLGVAMQASNLQIEQTDEDLANTLDVISKSGTSAGGATALAKMAATSKAQVAANIEKQELGNQQLRIEGEAQVMGQKMSLEQMALAEETAVWGRQEERDLTQMDRLSGQQANAQAQAFAHQQGGSQALQAGITGSAEVLSAGFAAQSEKGWGPE